MRLQNARHSFANYLLMTMVDLYYPKMINKELKHWARSSNLSLFKELNSNIFLPSINHNMNALYAISVVMGHSTPNTTLSCYIHCLDIMLNAQQEIRFLNQVQIPELAKKVNVERTNCNKILQRGNAKQYGLYPLVKSISFKKSDFKKMVLPRRDSVSLSDLSVNKISERYDRLNHIERIIRATEDNNSISDIMKMTPMSYEEIQSTIGGTIQVKQFTAYYGTSISANSKSLFFINNQQKTETASHYIHQNEFQNLLNKSSALSDKNLCYLSDVFIRSFDKRYGMVIAENDAGQLIQLARLLNYKTEMATELTSIRSKFGVRKGYHIKFIAMTISKKQYIRQSNNDNRFIHCLFLIAVFISSSFLQEGENK